MKRTMLSLLVVGLFAGIGTLAIAQNVTAGDQPAANAQAMAPEADSTTQNPAKSAKQTNPAKADDAAQMNGTDGAKPAKDFVGNSSDQPTKPKY